MTNLNMGIIHLATAFSFILTVDSRIGSGFIKDQRTDFVEFPPKVYKKYESPVPVGHLRPLGWQRPPEGKIQELQDMPAPADFYRNFVKIHKPVVFKNSMLNVPALNKWDKDTYLKDTYGEIDIHAVVKKELFKTGPKQMKFRKFLREYNYEDWYLSDIVPQQMMHELGLPKCLKCGFSKYLMESEIWFSSGDTSSTLHSHADHDLHCLLAGRKDFVFIDKKHREVFNYKDKVWPGAGHSEMDMDRINLFQHKGVAQVPWTWFTLRPGDCLFVPSGVPHQVRSYGRSFSSTYHWAPQPFEIDFSDCRDTKLEGFTPLNEANFLWTYADGHLHLTNAKLNTESLKHHLLVVMRNATVMTKPLFEDFYNEIMEGLNDKMPVDDVWRHLDPDGDGEVMRDEISNSLSDENLNKVAQALNHASELRAKQLRDSKDHDEL